MGLYPKIKKFRDTFPTESVKYFVAMLTNSDVILPQSIHPNQNSNKPPQE